MSGQTCLYLYGVVHGTALDSGPEDGNNGLADVSFVRFEDVACAVGSVPAEEYASMPTSGANQLDWLAPRAMRHHQVLQQLMARTTVVPLKFGTLCAGSEPVRDILRDKHDEFACLLSRLHGRSEWSVRIHADQEATRQHVRAGDPQLRAMQEQLAGRSPGETYLLGRKMHQLAGDLAADLFTALEQDAYDRLRQCVTDIVPGRPSTASPESARVEVASVAVLIGNQDFAALECVLENLEREYSQLGVTAELGGPWPPYNFSSLTLPVESKGMASS